MATLFNYSIATINSSNPTEVILEPGFLQASPATGDPFFADFTIQAINSLQPVAIRGISIGIPTGTAPGNLTNNPAAIQTQAPAGWNGYPVDSPGGMTTFVFVPPSGSTTIATGESLAFSFSLVPLISEPGIAGLLITEGMPGGGQGTLGLTLYPNDFGTVSFSAIPANANAGENVALNWAAPSEASCSIQYTNAGGTVVTIPCPGPSGSYPGPTDPALTLTQATTFTFLVSQTVNNIPFVLEIPQTVSTPPPPVTAYTGTLQQDGSLLLSWAAETAALVSISGTTPPTLPPSGIFAVPAPSFPLGGYALTAYDGCLQSNTCFFSGFTGPFTGPIGPPVPVGSNPLALVITPDGTHALVVNQGDNTVSVIDLTTSPASLACSIPVGNNPVSITVVSNPNTPMAYVVSQGDNCIYIINLASSPPAISYMPAWAWPGASAIAAIPNTGSALLANYENTISVINLTDPPTPSGIGMGSLPGYTVNQLVISPDGATAYTTNPSEGFGIYGILSTISLANRGELSFNAPVLNITYISITPDSSRALVIPGPVGNTVALFDPASLTITGNPITVGNQPAGIAFTPDGTLALVTNYNDNTVSVIDMSTPHPTVTGSPIPVGNGPTCIAVTPDGSRVLVLNSKDCTVSVLARTITANLS